jgi:AcrR family transcriptional regulator
MNFKQFCKEHRVRNNQLFAEFFDLHADTINIKNKKIAVEKLKTIITATFKLSANQSFASMSLRQLSEETQMSMGGLYAYIKNKQHLSLTIQQFLNHYCQKTLTQTGTDLESFIKTHVYLSEILQPWFFFAFMESKNLTKQMRQYAIKSELMTEAYLVIAIEKGQAQGNYKKSLSAQVAASHIKPLLHDWYLKRWKYRQRKINIDDFCQSMLVFINDGLKSH